MDRPAGSGLSGLVEKIDIGDSWCKLRPGGCQISSPALVWDGYDLLVLHITNRDIPGPKPVFWYDSDIHAREIATPELAMRYVEWLLGGYAANADAHWLVDYHDIYVMPIVNPDGHHMVELGDTSPYMVRKNSNYTDGCTYWGGGAGLGTDLNRNFPFLWGCCGGSSGSACSETYRGHAAGSEPEVRAITTTLRAIFPDQRGPNLADPAPVTTTGVIQSVHTVAELNLYPWGWTNDPTPNGADLANIAQHMSATDAGGNGYDPCQPGNCLYNVDGGSFDWQYGELGVPSFSTELGGSGFLPAYSEIEGLWNENKGMLVYLAKIARAPYLLAHGPDANSVTAAPSTVMFNGAITVTASIKYNWTGNAFSQNVAAAEVYVDTPPWAGGTPVAMAPVDGNFNAPIESARVTLDAGTLGSGRHVLFVRGRGLNDYAGYPTWGPVSAVFVDVTSADHVMYMPYVHGE